LAALPFLVWDAWFTSHGVWGFNQTYVLGIDLFGLPLEEVLFFFCVPFASLYIYQALARIAALGKPSALARAVWALAAFSFLAAAAFHADRAYTLTVCLAAAAAAGALAWRNPAWSALLLSATLAQYVPFLLVNGVLTGLPVVVYSPAAIVGLRIGSIPAEDFLYSFILLALPVTFYEIFTSGREPA
jgi:lycopene cyclase domain-containing protein